MKFLILSCLILNFSMILADVKEEFLSACSSTNQLEKIKDIIQNQGFEILNQRHPKSGQTCLMSAVLYGLDEVVEAMLSLNVDVTIGEKDGYTPMHGAGFQGRATIASKLIKYGIRPNDFHSDGYSPIHRAAWGRESRHTETVRVLITEGKVDPNTLSKDGKTAFDMTQNPQTKEYLKQFLNKKFNEDYEL